MKDYQSLFFDLDHTIWDFEKNASETLDELFHEYNLPSMGITNSKEFIKTYLKFNDLLWVQYRQGLLDQNTLRVKRFYQTFQEFGILDLKLSKAFGNSYIKLCPRKSHLFPQAKEVLEYLRPDYKLFLITNGFRDIQEMKLKNSGLETFFDEMITSEMVGVKKPHHRIFQYALRKTNSMKKNALMIGDDLTADMGGAIASGWDCVFFNPKKKEHKAPVTYEIHHLNELTTIL